MLVLLLPVMLWLHERFDTIVLVVLAGVAGAVDIIRFREGIEWLGLVNMVLVWGLCHQLGFFYERIVAAAANRRLDDAARRALRPRRARRQRAVPGVDGRRTRGAVGPPASAATPLNSARGER